MISVKLFAKRIWVRVWLTNQVYGRTLVSFVLIQKETHKLRIHLRHKIPVLPVTPLKGRYVKCPQILTGVIG